MTSTTVDGFMSQLEATPKAPMCRTFARAQRPPKVYFDPTNTLHIAAYRTFRTTGSWPDKCNPFLHEWPYITVPATIESKLLDHFLGINH